MPRHPYTLRLARPEEEAACWELERTVWAPYNWKAHGGVGLDYQPELHFVAVDGNDVIVATADACGLEWDGNPATLPQEGWRDVNLFAQAGFETRPEYASALGTSILAAARGGGLAADMLTALRDRALDLGYLGLLAPVRPSARARMPHVPIAEYADIRLANGTHFDPWVRVHERIGGRIIGTTPRSSCWWGEREEWEEWTGMRLPENGSVLIDGSTGWLRLHDGFGELIEDSIWLLHQPVPAADPVAELVMHLDSETHLEAPAPPVRAVAAVEAS